LVQQTTVVPGRKKRSHHKKNIKGPKFRHPPEPAHPNVIFSGIAEGDKADMGRGFARLYRDMIRYSISPQYHEVRQKQKEQGEPIGFKIKNIGYWLLDRNPDYIDYYSGSKSKTPDGRILDNIRQTLKSYLDHLQKWCIVKRLQEVDAETQNGTKTWLYGYGRVGLIIAWMLEYRDRSDHDEKQEAKNKIFNLIQRMFKGQSYSSYKEEFLAEFYHKLIEYDNNNNNNNDNNQSGLCDGVIRQIISAFENESHNKAFDYFDHLQTILLKPVGDLQTKQTILNLYLQTLEEVPKDTCEMVMYHDKDFFENKMSMSQPRKEWSKIWKENRTNYDTIVICCTCKNNDCPRYNNDGTLICDYYSYITARSLSAEDSYSQMDCPECKTQKSLYVYDTMNNLIDGIMNNSF
jgi:hypothetical protein